MSFTTLHPQERRAKARLLSSPFFSWSLAPHDSVGQAKGDLARTHARTHARTVLRQKRPALPPMRLCVDLAIVSLPP